MALLHLPIDFESWPEFRRLKAEAGASFAAWTFLRLFVELGHLAQVGELGFVSEEDATFFTAPDENQTSTKPLALLEVSGFLDRREKGWFCQRFARTQSHLDPNYVPMHMKGATVSRFVRNAKKFEAEALQQSLLIPPEIWKDPDGQSIPPETQKRIMLLLRLCDNALGLRERQPNAYTEGLVQEAARILRNYADEQIEGVFRWALLNRDHPSVPKTTEQFLPRFAEVAGCVK